MNISIEYCMQWNYEPRALSLRDALNERFGYMAELIESGGGVFEVTVNGDLIFSKKQLGRFPEHDEIINLVERFGLI